jgi:hypothetical protein
MNKELRSLVKEIDLDQIQNQIIRWKFCFYCAQSIRHLLELDEAKEAFAEFEKIIENTCQNNKLDVLQKFIQKIANQHPGSKSIDGTKHSAVSATYALSAAISGNAIAAAEYAAYAKIYGYGGYAVNDLENYKDEYASQVNMLKKIIHEERI